MLRRTFAIALVGAASALVLPNVALGDPKSEAAGPSAEQIAERVQAFYNRTKTFKAKFKQRYVVKAYDKTKDSAGDVIFEKPGKMSWRYTNNGNRVVSDGQIIKVYEKDNKQMYEQPLGQSQYPAALAFLTGSGNLKQSFKWEKLDARRMNFENGFVIGGTPLEATPAYQRIILYVDAATYQVRRVILIDAQSNKNRFDFNKPEVNTKAPPGEFNFNPPPGTQVIKP
ncbi:MAG TPA: outer membrane lipoprotein carrier protein LolA [Polyangiaceae bacterium]|nr:outer membrane lipoprotein carrier protein LolA [Polyangiaceae bacterium]